MFKDLRIDVLKKIDWKIQRNLSPNALRIYEELYIELFKYLPSKDKCPRIVDLGCGVGLLPKVLFDRGYTDYVGIDISKRRLEIAKQIVPEANFIYNDLFSLKSRKLIKSNKLFVCIEVLEHLQDDIKLLTYLPLGSTFIFSVPNYPSVYHVRKFGNINVAIKRYKGILEFQNKRVVKLLRTENQIYIYKTKRI